jgi:hypothetical protein
MTYRDMNFYLGVYTKDMWFALCGFETISQHSQSLRKVVYMGHRKRLRCWHLYQLAHFNIAFDESLENKGPPPLTSGIEMLARKVEYEDWMQDGNWPGCTNDP